MKINLKEARKSKDKLTEFIKDHSKDPKGDKEKFDKALDVISHPEKLKSTQETSTQDSSEN